jgi:malate synthase
MVIEVRGNLEARFEEILTEGALSFLGTLHAEFGPRRVELLGRRADRFEPGHATRPNFLEATSAVRQDPDWRVAPAAPGLVDRRVEMTGPPDRKMTINALNSGANVWMADFEDSNSPTWYNVIQGQLNLRDALERQINFTADNGKVYELKDDPELATVVVRPRGWHLVEKHLVVDGEPISGSLVDFGLYFYHCAKFRLDKGEGSYFYLPKLESHLEARLWNDVFVRASELIGIDHSTIRATVLIETIPAAFEMEEILYELREHSAGLNAGRWDYMFSMIKCMGLEEGFLLPDRKSLTMTLPFMRAYTELLVSTCHKRGAHAIGGMSAFIPSRSDAEVNAQALARVRADKVREATDGFDGSWVAHPGLVRVCRDVFDSVLGERLNQIDRLRDDVQVTADMLLDVASSPGHCSEEGLRSNIRIGITYLHAWLGGSGAVGISNMMEDVATAEISRGQVWQWLMLGIELHKGPRVNEELVSRLIVEERDAFAASAPQGGSVERLDVAVEIFRDLVTAKSFEGFLTTPAYMQID